MSTLTASHPCLGATSDSTNGGKSGRELERAHIPKPHPVGLTAGIMSSLTLLRQVFPNSSGANARTVVVRAFPDDVMATANLAIASRFGISTTKTASYWPVVTYYGVGANIRALQRVYRVVVRYWRKILRRRSWADRHFIWAAFIGSSSGSHCSDHGCCCRIGCCRLS